MNLQTCTVNDDTGLSIPFDVEPFRRHCLLNGLDDIGLSLAHEDKIAAYETVRGLAGWGVIRFESRLRALKLRRVPAVWASGSFC